MRQQTFTRRTTIQGLASGLACASASRVSAQSAADFYKGRRIALITAASAGGGYDQYARLLSRHMPRHIPGEPPMVVQNMVGAEGIKAANHLYNLAAQDGTVIGGLSRNTGLARFYDFNNAAIQFDARRFHWLGSPQQEIGLFIVNARTGVKTAADLKTRELSVSSTAHNSPSSIYSRMLNALYGTRLKPIDGYDGSQACLLAVERNEVDAHISGGSSAAFRSRIAPWLQTGSARVVMQMGMVRDAAFADIPTTLELLSAPADRQLFEIGFIEQVMGRPFVVGPGVPAERVALLRDAFDATMQDRDFLADAGKERIEIAAVDGATINAALDRAYTAPADVVERLRALAK